MTFGTLDKTSMQYISPHKPHAFIDTQCMQNSKHKIITILITLIVLCISVSHAFYSLWLPNLKQIRRKHKFKIKLKNYKL